MLLGYRPLVYTDVNIYRLKRKFSLMVDFCQSVCHFELLSKPSVYQCHCLPKSTLRIQSTPAINSTIAIM